MLRIMFRGIPWWMRTSWLRDASFSAVSNVICQLVYHLTVGCLPVGSEEILDVSAEALPVLCTPGELSPLVLPPSDSSGLNWPMVQPWFLEGGRSLTFGY